MFNRFPSSWVAVWDEKITMAANPLFNNFKSNRLTFGSRETTALQTRNETFYTSKATINNVGTSFSGKQQRLNGVANAVLHNSLYTSTYQDKTYNNNNNMDKHPPKRHLSRSTAANVPPDKRRRTDEEGDDLWGDDDEFALTQDEMLNLDNLMASQTLKPAATNFDTYHSNVGECKNSSRLHSTSKNPGSGGTTGVLPDQRSVGKGAIGKGAGRSLSSNDVNRQRSGSSTGMFSRHSPVVSGPDIQRSSTKQSTTVNNNRNIPARDSSFPGLVQENDKLKSENEKLQTEVWIFR